MGKGRLLSRKQLVICCGMGYSIYDKCKQSLQFFVIICKYYTVRGAYYDCNRTRQLYFK